MPQNLQLARHDLLNLPHPIWPVGMCADAIGIVRAIVGDKLFEEQAIVNRLR